MYSVHTDSEPEELEYPTDAEELSKWVENRDERTKHDYQDGFFFDLPERETSFDDSMHLAIFLAENGHYTQSMALLRVALNTLLASAMKSIVVSIPSRIEESDLIKKMFFSKDGVDGKKEIDREKIDCVDLSMSREGVWDRRALTHQSHNIYLRDGLRELEESKIITNNSKWAGKNRLRLGKLNSHIHAHDNVVDRYCIEPFEPERRFSNKLWDEFESIALAVLDLKLCITRRFNKEALDLRFKGFISKEAKSKLKFFDVSQYVPIFSSNLPPGALTRCIDCKIRTLSTGKQKARDFVCGTCKKNKELTESQGSE
jgi:hypothetical protein